MATNDNLRTTDEGYFVMKWGKFVALIFGIVVATNTVSVFMVSSEYADAKVEMKALQQQKKDDYIEARTKRRLSRAVKDGITYVDKKLQEAEIERLEEELEECHNYKNPTQ